MITIGSLASAVPAGALQFDERRHAAFFGATRSGKSTTLARIAIEHIRNDGPLFVLDPHGTLVDEILGYVPLRRLPDVVVFDPLDDEKQIGLNPLRHGDETAALSLIEILASQQGEHSFMGRSRDIATNFLLAAVYALPDPCPFDLALMFAFEEYAKDIFKRCPIAWLRTWGRKHFKKPDRQREDAEAAPSNKANALVTMTALRHIFAQADGLDLFECMQTNKIVLFNLRKGEIGEEPANLLGSVAMRMILAAAFRRAPHKNKQCLVIADEFHTITKGGNALDQFLAETAKFNISFMLADQTFGQLSESARRQIFANVSTLVSMCVSAEDAKLLGEELRMTEPAALVGLSTGEFYAKVKYPHVVLTAQHAFTPKWYASHDRRKKFPQYLPKKLGNETTADRCRRYSRENAGTKRAVVETRISKRLEAAHAAERRKT